MKKLYVYADFDWLKEIELIGELGYESLRGSDCYCFTFSKEWLAQHGDLFLSDDLNNYPGQQYMQLGKDTFGCFSDALPDRWGRTLLLRHEQIEAAGEKRPIRRLSSFDFLTCIDDFSRMGGFRFKEDPNGDFINVSESLRIPPLTDIRELIAASTEIEKSEENNILPDRKWVVQLVQPGSSLGGARPKASVIDKDKTLYVAKFPSRKDDYDAGLWEHFSHLLAIKAGINAAQTKVLATGEKYHTLFSKRFDRTQEGKRIHFASAMTLLGLEDGDNATNGHGYLDIVDFILQNCTDVERNLQELYRRVAFNISIGNSDDHFRNHGFESKSFLGDHFEVNLRGHFRVNWGDHFKVNGRGQIRVDFPMHGFDHAYSLVLFIHLDLHNGLCFIVEFSADVTTSMFIIFVLMKYCMDVNLFVVRPLHEFGDDIGRFTGRIDVIQEITNAIYDDQSQIRYCANGLFDYRQT